MKTKYIADDGSEFESEALCRAYERLMEASKDSAFHKTVEGLFNGCQSFEGGGSDPWDTCYPVLRLGAGKHMDKFKANLVQALPKLQFQLDAALARGDIKG
jgi:hypothetical protein